MEKLDGEKLVPVIKRQYEDMAAAQGKTFDQLRAEFEAKARDEPAKPPPTAAQMQLYINAIRAGDWVSNALRGVYNYSLGLVAGQLKYVQTPLPINHVAIMDLLMRVHAHEIFVNGVFNGDCHPGNIFLMPNGEVGLIDYGQVKTISTAERIELSKLIIALSNNSKSQVVEQFTRMGFRSEKMDPYVIGKTAVFFFDRDDKQTTEGMNIQAYMEYLTARDKTTHWPDQYLMAARTGLLLRGLGTLLSYPITVADRWRPYAEQVLREHELPIVAKAVNPDPSDCYYPPAAGASAAATA